jgi:hypothetical protein
MIPGVRLEIKPNDRWSIDGAFDFTRGEGLHLYDNFQSGLLVTYMRPIRRTMDDGAGGILVDYPLRISAGLQQQSFFSFTGPGNTSSYRPVVRISLF